MLEKKYCPACGGEITIRYNTPDKNYRIENGKLVRDDASTGPGFDDAELLFECSNDREHELPVFDGWEETISEEFFRGAYYVR